MADKSLDELTAITAADLDTDDLVFVMVDGEPRAIPVAGLRDALVLLDLFASPTLTGTPLAPTASPGDNSTKIATTAFVAAALAALIDSAPGALDTLNELAAALGDDSNFAATVTAALALKAAIASPTFTGSPAAPTQAAGDRSTLLATTAWVGGEFRERLRANRTYYVNASTGSDSNSGLGSGTAFATIQAAINAIAAIDMAGYAVTVSVAAGTYAAVVAKSLLGGNVEIVGDETTPTNVVISTSTSAVNGFDATNCFGGSYTLAGMKITATGSQAYAINADNSAVLFRNMNFGACDYGHLRAVNGGSIVGTGNYAISGSAREHIRTGNAGTVTVRALTITLTGTPNFSNAFARARSWSSIQIDANTFTGSATGSRYDVNYNGAIITNGGGASYLPGNSAGTADAATNGIYG